MARGIPLAREQVDDLVVAIAAGASQREAAARVGVSRKAVELRMKDPEFVAEVDAARDVFADRPELATLYQSLARIRAALRTVKALDSTDFEVVAEEAIRHLSLAEKFVEEWAWLLEQ